MKEKIRKKKYTVPLLTEERKLNPTGVVEIRYTSQGYLVKMLGALKKIVELSDIICSPQNTVYDDCKYVMSSLVKASMVNIIILK